MNTVRPVPGWVGVLLAAGRGRRMGRLKQLVTWPATDKALVASAFDAISPVCTRLVVVLGHEAGAVESALRPRNFETVLADPDAPMFESVRAGLKAAAQAGGTAGIVLQPSDHPGVRAETLQRLMAEAAPCQKAVVPEFAGKGGHPAMIPVSLVPAILAYGGSGGLREFWQANSGSCVRVVVDDPGVVRDVDTQEDLGSGARP